MKRLATSVVLLLAVASLISACASRDEGITGQPSLQSGATVPGERVSDGISYSRGSRIERDRSLVIYDGRDRNFVS